MYYCGRQKACWNGPQCRFLHEGKCTFYHPSSHHHPQRFSQLSHNGAINYTSFSDLDVHEKMTQLLAKQERKDLHAKAKKRQREDQAEGEDDRKDSSQERDWFDLIVARTRAGSIKEDVEFEEFRSESVFTSNNINRFTQTKFIGPSSF